VTAERLVAAVPEDHPLARRQGTTLAELLSHPLVCMPPGTGIRAVLDRACAEQGLHPEITLEAAAPPAVADLARLGLGVGVLSESMVRPPLTAVPITDATGPAVLALVWSRAPNPALDRLVRELRRAFGRRQAHSGEDGEEE
jgi:DNA-binding transcriptional LysR family regulator